MASEGCSYRKAIDLAIGVVEENIADVFTPETRRRKLAELIVTSEIFDRASEGCFGRSDDGTCPVAPVLNHTVSLVFGNPTIEVVAKPTHQLGLQRDINQ